jgi:hypothetical protein
MRMSQAAELHQVVPMLSCDRASKSLDWTLSVRRFSYGEKRGEHSDRDEANAWNVLSGWSATRNEKQQARKRKKDLQGKSS